MNVRSTALLLGVLLLVSGSAWAQSTGVQLYESGEYETAVRLLEQQLTDAQLPSVDQAQARVYLAASLHALGEAEEARKQLELLAREHPEQRLDPVRFPPELVTLAEAIRQRVSSERESAAREAQLRKEREEALRLVQPVTPIYLRSEVLGLFEAVDRSWTVGAGVSLRRESLEGGLRVQLGDPPAIHLQVGWLPGHGDWSVLLGLRATLLPGIDSYGAGPVVGGRIALPGGLVGLVDLGADYFFSRLEDRHRFAVTVQAGLGFDVRLQ